MNKKFKSSYLINFIALFLGGICVYIYIPLVGYAFSFLMNQEFYIQIQRIVFNIGEQGGLSFKLLHFVQNTIFLFIICILILYFFAEKLRKALSCSILFMLGGAIASDYFSYISMSKIMSQIFFPQEIPFSHSTIFFGNSFLVTMANLFILCLIFYASIVIGSKASIYSLKKYLIKVKQDNQIM